MNVMLRGMARALQIDIGTIPLMLRSLRHVSPDSRALQRPRPPPSCRCCATASTVSAPSTGSPPLKKCLWNSNSSWCIPSRSQSNGTPSGASHTQRRCVLCGGRGSTTLRSRRLKSVHSPAPPSPLPSPAPQPPLDFLPLLNAPSNLFVFVYVCQCVAQTSHQPVCSFQNLLATSWHAGASSDAVVEVRAFPSPSTAASLLPSIAGNPSGKFFILAAGHCFCSE
jgi:hypothetical protein